MGQYPISSSNIRIPIDKPAPARIIIPALEVIQPGLLRLCMAARAKLGGKKLGITGPKAAVFIVPGEGLPLPGVGCGGTGEQFRCILH